MLFIFTTLSKLRESSPAKSTLAAAASVSRTVKVVKAEVVKWAFRLSGDPEIGESRLGGESDDLQVVKHSKKSGLSDGSPEHDQEPEKGICWLIQLVCCL